MLSRGWIPF